MMCLSAPAALYPAANSLPTTIVANEEYSTNYTFELSRLPKPALIQNKDNLHVIAIIVDTTTKRVINANRSYITDFVINVVPGDVNEDGEVSIADVTDLVDYILNNETVINAANADVDEDGSITIADVTGLIDKIMAPN